MKRSPIAHDPEKKKSEETQDPAAPEAATGMCSPAAKKPNAIASLFTPINNVAATFSSPPAQLPVMSNIFGHAVTPWVISRKNPQLSPSDMGNATYQASPSKFPPSSSRINHDPASQATAKTYPEKTKQQRDRVYLICSQHCLDTTATLIKTTIEKGIKPQHIYFLDKLYSTNEGAWGKIKELLLGEQNMIRLAAPSFPWLYGENLTQHVKTLYKKVIADIEHRSPDEKPYKIILLDDSRLIELFPEELLQYSPYGIAHTTFVYNILKKNPPHFPWISAATNSLKRYEDPFIGDLAAIRVNELVQKIKEKYPPQQEIRCGIIGLGHIGGAVAQALIKSGYKVSFYDPKIKEAPLDINQCTSAADLITNCNIIIGCTGYDTLKGLKLESLIHEDKWFISTSSEAIEFSTPMQTYVLQNMNEYTKNPFTDLKSTMNSHIVTYVNAGFPATFDPQKKDAVPAKDIDITRSLLFGAFYQWLCHKINDADKNPDIGREDTPLDPNIQNRIDQEWQRTHPESQQSSSSSLSYACK